MRWKITRNDDGFCCCVQLPWIHLKRCRNAHKRLCCKTSFNATLVLQADTMSLSDILTQNIAKLLAAEALPQIPLRSLQRSLNHLTASGKVREEERQERKRRGEWHWVCVLSRFHTVPSTHFALFVQLKVLVTFWLCAANLYDVPLASLSTYST